MGNDTTEAATGNSRRGGRSTRWIHRGGNEGRGGRTVRKRQPRFTGDPLDRRIRLAIKDSSPTLCPSTPVIYVCRMILPIDTPEERASVEGTRWTERIMARRSIVDAALLPKVFRIFLNHGMPRRSSRVTSLTAAPTGTGPAFVLIASLT